MIPYNPDEVIPFEVEDPKLGIGLIWLYDLSDEAEANPFCSWLKAKFVLAAAHASYGGRKPFLKAPRNDPCPCGSNVKTKKCGCQAYAQQSAGSDPNLNTFKK